MVACAQSLDQPTVADGFLEKSSHVSQNTWLAHVIPDQAGPIWDRIQCLTFEIQELSKRAIFFDLVGTLIRGRRPIGEEYAVQLERFGVVADPWTLDSAFKSAMRDAPAMAFPGRTIQEAGDLERQWWRAVVSRVLATAGVVHELDGGHFDSFFASLFAHFATGQAWEVYPDVLPALTSLKSAGFLLGLITNYDTRVSPVLESQGLSSLLDSVTIPAQVGAAKPDAAIFARALASLGLHPGEAVYVGDEMDDDYRGAEAAGLTAVLLDREGRHRGVAGVRRIGSLADLVTTPG